MAPATAEYVCRTCRRTLRGYVGRKECPTCIKRAADAVRERESVKEAPVPLMGITLDNRDQARRFAYALFLLGVNPPYVAKQGAEILVRSDTLTIPAMEAIGRIIKRPHGAPNISWEQVRNEINRPELADDEPCPYGCGQSFVSAAHRDAHFRAQSGRVG